MSKLDQGEIEGQLTGANKLVAQQAIRLNQQLMVLAADMPETGRGLIHISLRCSLFRWAMQRILHVGQKFRRGAATRWTVGEVKLGRSGRKAEKWEPGSRQMKCCNQSFLLIRRNGVTEQEQVKATSLNFFKRVTE